MFKEVWMCLKLLFASCRRKLDLREDPEKGVFVPDLTYAVVDTAETMDKVMTEGNKHRHVGATAMNAVSSRSHSIFTVVIEASENRCVACVVVSFTRGRCAVYVCLFVYRCVIVIVLQRWTRMHYPRQVESGGFGGLGAYCEDGGSRHSDEGGHQDQPQLDGAGQCHFCTG